MGIRKKIFLGFMVIAFILFLAGVAIIFEMRRIRSSVTVVLSENVASMNAANSMQRYIDKQNMMLFNYMSTHNDSILLDLRNSIYVENYEKSYRDAKNTISITGEQEIIDSLDIYHNRYKRALDALIETNKYSTEKEAELHSQTVMYFSDNYDNITELINQLFLINKKTVEENSVLMKDNYYRMIMPAIISIIAGIALIFLFYTFILSYLIKPTEKISKGISAFTATRVPYDLEIETKDEVSTLNKELKKLTELTRKIEKENKQLQP